MLGQCSRFVQKNVVPLLQGVGGGGVGMGTAVRKQDGGGKVQGGRVACAGQAKPLARIGSGALSLADPIGPPPSVVTGRDNGSEGTPGLLGLSRGPSTCSSPVRWPTCSSCTWNSASGRSGARGGPDWWPPAKNWNPLSSKSST
jgi:hypothetical protein